MRIALVNCAVLPEPDIDEAPLLGALRGAGHEAETLAWDDPGGDPGAFDACFLRATWNYYERLDAFLAWCDRASERTRLLNPPAVVRWNAHKGYLRELEAAGVPVVATEFVGRGSGGVCSTIAGERGWGEVVVKPAESAGSWGTRRFAQDRFDEADAFLSEWSAGRDMMVQRYLPSVQAGGERALVWVCGEFTHAVIKAPRFDDDDESITGRDRLTPEELDIAQRVMRAAGRDVFYARVDVMALDDGSLALSELELIEPSLYFKFSDRALGRFVAGVERMSGAVRTEDSASADGRRDAEA